MRNVVEELSKIRQTMAQAIVDLSQLSQRMSTADDRVKDVTETYRHGNGVGGYAVQGQREPGWGKREHATQAEAPTLSDHARLNSLINRFEGLVQWLKIETTAGTREMEALKQKVELHRQRADKEFGTIADLVQAFSRQLTAVENKNAALDAGLSELSGQIATLNARLNAVDQALGAMGIQRTEAAPSTPEPESAARAAMGSPVLGSVGWPEDPALR